MLVVVAAEVERAWVRLEYDVHGVLLSCDVSLGRKMHVDFSIGEKEMHMLN